MVSYANVEVVYTGVFFEAGGREQCCGRVTEGVLTASALTYIM